MKTTGSHCHPIHDILYQGQISVQVSFISLFSQTMNTGYSQRLLFEIAVIPFVLQWTNATENCGVCGLTYYCKGSTKNSEMMLVFTSSTFSMD